MTQRAASFWCVSARDVIVVTGRDAATYLQSQVSQDLRPLEPGSSVWSFVLSPTGKVDALVRVHRVDDEVFELDTDAGSGEVALARLLRFRIRVDVRFELSQREFVAFRGADLPPSPVGALVAWGSGYDVPAGSAADMASRALVAEGTADDLLAARIEACWPGAGAEIVAGETLAAETGLVGVAVNFGKGCYPGQELVERMDSRGSTAPRHLETVDVPAGTAVGAPYLRDGVEVGVVTSVVGTRAIARLRRPTP